MARYMNYHEALERAIKGEILSEKRLTEGCVCYLRRMAWSIGCVLQDSGIGSYRTYSFVKS